MILLGIVLLVVGIVLGIHVLFILGLVLALIGACLMAATAVGRGPGRYWW